ncbi:MAG: hypothetical protein NTU47_00630 [Ignavibacteriales bacterium]|nr:hypothetical protein [Ignavibacteriales bacterium]
MNIKSSFMEGLKLASRTKRMILFAWFLNVFFAMVLALPVLKQLDGYLRDSVMDEKILKQLDPAWVDSYRVDMEKSEYTRALDLTIFGFAPFLNQLEMQMQGGFVRSLAGFLYDFFVRWQLNPGQFSLLFFISLLYVCVNTFLAGGFVGIYSKDYRSSFPEFLMDGARYFGKFFRLALVALIIYYLFFAVVVDWFNNSIAEWTQRDASESIPFLYYMIRNIVVLLLMSFLLMVFDYARIRMVVDDRTSALGSSIAGARFAVPHLTRTYGLYLLLTAIGMLLILVYAVLERIIPQDSYWPLVFLFVVQQLYMIARLWLKATFYASQVTMYRTVSQQEHLKSVSAVPSTI